jgi:hypothetical protein
MKMAERKHEQGSGATAQLWFENRCVSCSPNVVEGKPGVVIGQQMGLLTEVMRWPSWILLCQLPRDLIAQSLPQIDAS